MADETTHTTERIYCTGENCNNALLSALMSKKDNDPMTMMAMMNGGGFGGWQNPLMYIMYMWLFRYMNGNGWGNGSEEGLNWNNRALTQIQSSIDNNHNADLTMDAIKGNASAIHELATNLNMDFNTVQQAICGVKSAIEQVGANVGFSAERVINAVNQGDGNIINAIQTTSCATQKAIIEQGYQNQLMNERQTGVLGGKIDAFQNQNQFGQFQMQTTLGNQITDTRQAIVNGFANLGYTLAQQACDLKTNSNNNTQRIIDTLNQHWVAEQSQELQTAKFEISQMKQNQVLLNAINGGCNCNG